jgi:DNA-binding NtrC family response regulator
MEIAELTRPVKSRNARILVIDDERAVRGSIRGFLEDRDYQVLEAEDGRQGIEILKGAQPALVLVDLRMPEVDGLDVLSYAREHAPETPTIVVSGTGFIGQAIEALRLGAQDYLLKPIKDMNVLMHAVDRALGHARLMDENRRLRASG